MQTNFFELSLSLTKAYETAAADKKGDWVVEGIAASSNVDLAAECLTQRALQDLCDGFSNLKTMFLNHVTTDEIGNIRKVEVRGDKLWFQGVISKTRPDVWQKIQDGTLNKFSVQFIPVAEHNELDATGRSVRYFDRARALELSLVGLPANSEADLLQAYVRKSMRPGPDILAALERIERNTKEMDARLAEFAAKKFAFNTSTHELAERVAALGHIPTTTRRDEDEEYDDPTLPPTFLELPTDESADHHHSPMETTTMSRPNFFAKPERKGFGSSEQLLFDERLSQLEKDLEVLNKALGGLADRVAGLETVASGNDVDTQGDLPSSDGGE
jgi:HK97 family phage prohead protease